MAREQRDRMAEAITREHYRRAEQRIEASPEEHGRAFADAAMAAIEAEADQALATEDDLKPIRFIYDPRDAGNPCLEVSGVDLLKGSFIKKVQFEVDEYSLIPTFTITLAMHRVEIEGAAKIELGEGNDDLLLKLGWRPPAK